MIAPPPPPVQEIGTALRVEIRCTEDMKCWNWKTMGNHCRGLNRTQILCYNPRTKRFWRKERRA